MLYLSGMAFSGLFWIGLVRTAGGPLSIGAGLRAYYISHIGKYTPGMGLPTVMRMTHGRCRRRPSRHGRADGGL